VDCAASRRRCERGERVVEQWRGCGREQRGDVVERGGLRVRPAARGGDGGVEGRDGGRGESLPHGGHWRQHGGDWIGIRFDWAWGPSVKMRVVVYCSRFSVSVYLDLFVADVDGCYPC
jgi:hypothetical protein